MPEVAHWRPNATWTTLHIRGRLLRQIREFFFVRNVLEVETPLLCAAAASDPHLRAIAVDIEAQAPTGRKIRFLQTSPESCMKRLLAAGSGPIFQICKAFRDGEIGPNHNLEFTIVEWYRPGFYLEDLINEVEALIADAINVHGVKRLAYREVLRAHAGLDPSIASLHELRTACEAFGASVAMLGQMDRDECLDLLLSAAVQPALGPGLCVVEGFPASQASMAALDPRDPTQALRFEFYLNGNELANGYQELCEADELAARMRVDNHKRMSLGLPDMPMDEHLLAALRHGLPNCSGVALGFDRLLVEGYNLPTLSESLSFDTSRA